jgi:hypothetical protein
MACAIGLSVVSEATERTATLFVGFHREWPATFVEFLDHIVRQWVVEIVGDPDFAPECAEFDRCGLGARASLTAAGPFWPFGWFHFGAHAASKSGGYGTTRARG